MTTLKPTPVSVRPELPEIPKRHEDEVTQYDHLFHDGNSHHLLQHLFIRGADRNTTLMSADKWIVEDFSTFVDRARYPDLLVAFHVDPAAYKASNGYVITEQGKPPDFVLEVASPSTGKRDLGSKRDDYEYWGILEYWRFDPDGKSHGARLGGDRMVNGRYEPLSITEPTPGIVEGYSEVLNMILRWEDGDLYWVEPTTGRPVSTFEQERAGRIEAELRAQSAQQQVQSAQQQAQRAEARVAELEAELRRLQERAD